MFEKLPMNLQYFADEGNSEPESGAPEGAEIEEPKDEEPKAKTFTQDEVDSIVKKRLERFMKDKQQEIDDAKSEAVEYAKMNKDEKQQHDLEKAQAEAKKAKSDLARYQLRDATRAELISGGYTPTDADIDMVVAGDAETTKKNTQSFLEMVERVRENVRNDLLKGATPLSGGDPVKKPKSLNDMSLMERVKLRQDDPAAYQELVNKTMY